MAQPQAVANAGTDGHDVFYRSADFDSDRIRAGVQPESRAGEGGLHGFRQRAIGGSHHQGGWVAAGDFAGESGAGDDGDARGEVRFELLSG